MTSFLAAQSRAVLDAYARGLGVPGDAFERGELTIAPRPDSAPWPYHAYIVTAPSGTAMSLDHSLVAFAQGRPPERPFQAGQGWYAHQLAGEVERQGGRAIIDGPNVCWALGEVPVPPNLPSGLRYEGKDRDWLNALLPDGRFPNGAGDREKNARAMRNRYAVALVDAEGSTVAVAGAFDTFGLMEVGIDVVAGRQGEGLGAAAVAALVCEIVERGETPLYGCAATNIRSQRTAHATGFVPVFCDVSIER